MAVSLAFLGNDLLVTPFFEATEWDTVDLTLDPPGRVFLDEAIDIGLARGVQALQQSLVLRLLTPQGSLRDLGHGEYGSRLHELIGQENAEAARLRARSHVIQCLAQEPRIEKVLSLEVETPASDAADRLRIHVRVLAVGGGDPIALGLEVGL